MNTGVQLEALWDFRLARSEVINRLNCEHCDGHILANLFAGTIPVLREYRRVSLGEYLVDGTPVAL